MSQAAREKAQSEPESLALADEARDIDWSALDETLNRIANALLGTSFRKERRVAVLAHNCAEAVLAYLGCLHAGVSASPVISQLKADEVAYILEDSGSEILFVGPGTLEVGLEAANRLGQIEVIAWNSPYTEGVTAWDGWLAAASDKPPPEHMKPLPYLQYTSGTTGKAKAVEAVAGTLPQAETVAEFFAALRSQPTGLPKDKPHLVTGPLYFNANISAIRALAVGQPLVVMSKFDAEEALRVIDRYGVGSTVMVPTHFQRLLALPKEVRDRYDVSSLESVAHTGAACSRDIKKAMIEWFGPVLLEAYGGTESGATNMITSQEWLSRPGSVGRTIEPFELQIIGEEGKRLGPNQVGQVFFRDKSGRGIIYKNDPEKTRAAHREPGVFTLGEVGYYDEEGYLYITDRVSDMIVSGGVNIYPVEVEHVLLSHPEIVDAAVIGVPSDDLGEEVKALVVPREIDRPPEQEELIRFCREGLAHYKCPRSVEIVSDVGRTPVGKINKRALRAPYWPTDRTIGG